MDHLLEEILIKPSNEIKTDRFNTEHDEAAFCSGKCSTVSE
jgi:hypothetical protein